jgi:ankyrin repeat protein
MWESIHKEAQMKMPGVSRLVLSLTWAVIVCAQVGAPLNPSILDAARRGDEAAIRSWLGSGAPIDARSKDGLTALLAAAQGNQAGVMRLLIASGADVNARDADGSSALLTAALNAGPEVVRLLIDGGARLVDASTQFRANAHADLEDAYTPLLYMTIKGQSENVTRMLAAGADPNHKINDRSLTMYSSEHDWAALVDLLDRAARPKAAAPAAVRDPFKRGYTPLMVAAAKGDAVEFKRLLQAGANWRSVTASRTSLLMFAAQGGSTAIIDSLLRLGAKGGGPNAAGWTSVMYAAVRGDAATVRKLLDAGVDAAIPEEEVGQLVLACLTPEIRQLIAKAQGQ